MSRGAACFHSRLSFSLFKDVGRVDSFGRQRQCLPVEELATMLLSSKIEVTPSGGLTAHHEKSEFPNLRVPLL